MSVLSRAGEVHDQSCWRALDWLPPLFWSPQKLLSFLDQFGQSSQGPLAIFLWLDPKRNVQDTRGGAARQSQGAPGS